jgi:hypothetical protein
MQKGSRGVAKRRRIAKRVTTFGKGDKRREKGKGRETRKRSEEQKGSGKYMRKERRT